jgi:type I restriction enzyme S subunit
MMKVYPEYKDSGVDWLGAVPSHWDKCQLGHLFYIFNGSTPKSDESSYWDGDINWATPSDLSKITPPFINGTIRKITEEGFNSCGTSIVPKGSLILSTRAPIGSLAIASLPMCTNQGCKSLVSSCENKVNNKFYYYLLSISTELLNLRGRGTTFLELPTDELASFHVPKLSFEEQSKIVGFLDVETTRIDSLISEKQNFIKLLQEKRQALISHVVTKGLDSNVEMKDSGVEWIGEMPEHWDVKKIKYIFDYITDKESCKNKFTIALENIGSKTGHYIETNSEYEADGVPFINGDTLFGKLRPYLEKVYFCKEQGMSFGDILVFRPNDMLEPEFGYYLMSNSEMIKIIDSSTFGTKMPRANPDYIRNMWHSIPSKKEQKEIVEFLNKKSISYQKIQDETKKSVELLKEHRIALISATVTGKIDVREMA